MSSSVREKSIASDRRYEPPKCDSYATDSSLDRSSSSISNPVGLLGFNESRQNDSNPNFDDHDEDSSTAIDTEEEEILETMRVNNQVETAMILHKICDLTIRVPNFVPEEKDMKLLILLHDIVKLDNQVKQRKDWAYQKAIQAARKLSDDLTELNMLRSKREETLRLKQEKPSVEDCMIKRLSEMDTALREVSGQLDHVRLIIRDLEVENAEIKAEIHGLKLSASESVTMCLEVERREKKCVKKMLAWVKQRASVQDDINAEKQRIVELQEEMVYVEAAKETAEVTFRKVQKAKERALAQLEEERRLRKATKANNKRNHEILLSKIELDSQRYKDDLQRLKHELSQIKTSTETGQQLTNPYGSHFQNQTIDSMLYESDDCNEKDGIDRACIICKKNEISVLFLPCAHQVLCASCNDEYGKKGKAKCPICRGPIEEKIRVFGGHS